MRYIGWGVGAVIEDQHVDTSAHQVRGGFAVQSDFPARAGGVQVPAVGDAACSDAFGYEPRVGGENHGQVREENVVVDGQEELQRDTVELLQDERGRQVAVADTDFGASR